MVENDDKYGEDGENLTQVRSIIKHLNEDKPSQERVREVVVRADGSKVVRVTKKRRVMLTSADIRRRNRRHVLYILAAGMLVLLLVGGFLFFRVATMSSSAYMQERQAALQQAWGATSVQIEGAGVEGTTLNVSGIVAEFPESSMLQRVELNGMTAKLDVMSFLTGELQSENLVIERALVVLRSGKSMDMPKMTGKSLWNFRRMDCKDFSILSSEAENRQLSLKNANAYMYYPSRQRSASVLMLRDGVLGIPGWKSVRIKEGKAHIAAQEISDFSVTGTTDAETSEIEQRRTSISFSGKIEAGASLCGPFAVEADNMTLADFTEGRLAEFMTARTRAVSHGKLNGKLTMLLSSEGQAPKFKGELQVKDFSLRSFPALMAIAEHIAPDKRGKYNPLSLHRGRLNLDYDGDSLVVEIPQGALESRDLATLRGKIVLSGANELSGDMKYGVPMMLARVEYPDGQPDPIFQQSGEWAILSTNLKGNGTMPGDDMAEVEARASIVRRDRPQRIPFSDIDVNRLSEQLINNNPVQNDVPEQPVSQPQPVNEPAPAPSKMRMELDNNPFEVAEDPFAPAPATPF